MSKRSLAGPALALLLARLAAAPALTYGRAQPMRLAPPASEALAS